MTGLMHPFMLSKHKIFLGSIEAQNVDNLTLKHKMCLN